MIGCALKELESGKSVEGAALEQAASLPVDGFERAVAAGLSGALDGCVAKLEPGGDISSLRDLAIGRGLRSLLDGLRVGAWPGVGSLSDWVERAIELEAYDEALALCTEDPGDLSVDVLSHALRALALGGRDERADVLGLRALDLGLWDEHLVDVAQGEHRQ